MTAIDDIVLIPVSVPWKMPISESFYNVVLG
jgi:hypothetical protein